MRIRNHDATSSGGIDFRTVASGLGVALPLLGVAGVVGPLLLGYHSLAIIATYVAVPCLLAPVFGRYVSDTERADAVSDRHGRPLLMAGFFCALALSVVLLATNEVRPHSYYVVVAVMALLLLLQILRVSRGTRRVWPILAQIALLQLDLVWGVTLKYNYFVGRTDVFGHVYYVRQILANNVVQSDLVGFYESFPLWHVLGAMGHLVSGGHVPPRTVLFVTSGILYALVPVGVYLVARRLFESPRVALAAGLFTCLSSTVIHNGMYSIPRSVGAFLFVFVLLAWVWDDHRSVFLFALFAVAIAAYHTVSLPFVFVILAVDFVFRRYGVSLLSTRVVPRRFGKTSLLLGLLVLVQAAYWLFFAEGLLEHVVSLPFQESPPGQINTGVVTEPLRELANYVHNSAMLLFVFVSALIGLSSDRIAGKTKATLLTALVLVGLSFPGPQLLVGALAESFNVLRFAQYAFPFIAMAGAYGAVTLLGGVSISGPTAETVKVLALVAFLVFSLATVSNDFVASDNPAVERQFYTNYVSEAEERGMQTVAGYAAGNVSSDYVVTRYYESSAYADRARILGVSGRDGELHTGSESDVVLLRDSELTRRPLQVWVTDDYRDGVGYLSELGYVEGSAPVWSDLETTNRVYDSGAVTAYGQSPIPSNESVGRLSSRPLRGVN